MNRLQLFDVAVPLATDSYAPVSHQNIIEETMEQLDKYNMKIIGEKYNTSADGKKVIGYYDIERTDSPDMNMRLAFRNSYDKSMSVAFTSGAQVWICSNGCVKGDMVYMRKHTGGVARELRDRIVETIQTIDGNFIELERQAAVMKNIQFGKDEAAAMYGKLFMQHDVLNSAQMSIVKRQLEMSDFVEFREDTLWSAYNHATFALKESHPSVYIPSHAKLHKFIEQEFFI